MDGWMVEDGAVLLLLLNLYLRANYAGWLLLVKKTLFEVVTTPQLSKEKRGRQWWVERARE